MGKPEIEIEIKLRTHTNLGLQELSNVAKAYLDELIVVAKRGEQTTRALGSPSGVVSARLTRGGAGSENQIETIATALAEEAIAKARCLEDLANQHLLNSKISRHALEVASQFRRLAAEYAKVLDAAKPTPNNGQQP